MFLFGLYIMHSSFAVKTQPCVMYQIYTWQLILPPTSSFGEICVDSDLVSVLPYEWFLWKELLVACSFWKNLMIITKYYKSREVSFLHLFAVQAPREEGGNPSGSTQVWMVERHVYKSYNMNPIQQWQWFSPNDWGGRRGGRKEHIRGPGVFFKLHPLAVFPLLVLPSQFHDSEFWNLLLRAI